MKCIDKGPPRCRRRALPLSNRCEIHQERGGPSLPKRRSDLIQTLADKYATRLSRSDIKGLLKSMATIGHAELKKNGIFVVPGLVRLVVVKKRATKERRGINPFTGQATVFKAKPARKVVKGRPVKAAKDAVA
jgi:DNA-binding protein HU-beta